MHAKWIAAAALLLPLAREPSALPPAAQSTDEYVITGSDEGVELEAFVASIQALTGEPFLYDPKDLKDELLVIKGTVRIPKDKLMSFFELSLHSIDFVHLELMEGGKRIHRLQKLGQLARGQMTLKQQARLVEVAELRGLADRWTLVTTTYTCKNLPAREAVTTIVNYFADASIESIRAIEGTQSIVMTGFAANLANLVTMLDRIEADIVAAPEFTPMPTLEKRLAALEAKVAALEAKGGGR